jgi:hypothetical protein
MRGRLFRPGAWIAAAVLGLALVGACSLNPQPLPPEGAQSSADAGAFGNGSSSGGGSGGGGFPTSSSGSSSGGSSGGTFTGPGSDAGTLPVGSEDAAVENDASTTPDAATDSGLPNDGGADTGLPDGAADASSDASPDAALDDASTSDGCMHASDCYASHPGACAVCTWPQNFAVCIAHECRCGCDGRDAAGE